MNDESTNGAIDEAGLAELAPAEQPPQGIVVRHLLTGDAQRDRLSLGLHQSVPMIDPACLGEAPYLAIPIEGDGTRVRVKQFNADIAAEKLSREQAPPYRVGIRLATDAEVTAYHAEASVRAAQGAAERERRAQVELDRFLGEEKHRAATTKGIREMYAPPKQPTTDEEDAVLEAPDR